MSSSTPTKILLIGSGKLAKHFGRYFSLQGIAFQTASRSQDSSEAIKQKIKNHDHVFLLIKDSALLEFTQNYPEVLQKQAFHCSGATTVPGVKVLHPLMTFGENFYEQSVYESFVFVTSDDVDLKFLGLKNRVLKMSEDDRAAYHALCVMSGNFPAHIWRECFQSFKKFGLTTSDVAPYLKVTLQNVLDDPQKNITGPHARGDLETIQTNQDALENHGFMNLALLYKKFTEWWGV